MKNLPQSLPRIRKEREIIGFLCELGVSFVIFAVFLIRPFSRYKVLILI
jgi:hypothetical protein